MGYRGRNRRPGAWPLLRERRRRERHVWTGFYEEMFAKALGLAKEGLSGGFDVNAAPSSKFSSEDPSHQRDAR
jgi:hypothetical protein